MCSFQEQRRSGQPCHVLPMISERPQVDSACADRPGFLVPGAADAWLSASSRSLRLLPGIGNQPAPYRGFSGPSGPKCRKSLENVGPRKVSRKSRKQSEKTLSTLFRDSFPDYSRDLARETSVRGGLVPNPWTSICCIGSWTSAWSCCPQLPYHPCKNGTYNTSFCNTKGRAHTHTHTWDDIQLRWDRGASCKWMGFNLSCSVSHAQIFIGNIDFQFSRGWGSTVWGPRTTHLLSRNPTAFSKDLAGKAQDLLNPMDFCVAELKTEALSPWLPQKEPHMHTREEGAIKRRTCNGIWNKKLFQRNSAGVR